MYNNPYLNQPYLQMPRMNGRVVNDFAEISANDVPLDGSLAYFPKADMSEIQVRRWNPNGQISTFSFAPVSVQADVRQQANKTPLETLTARIERIERMLDEQSSNDERTKLGTHGLKHDAEPDGC